MAAHTTAEQLDRELAAAQSAIAGIGASLLELESARTHRAPEAAHLTGSSAAAWETCGRQLEALWTCYHVVTLTLTAVADQRAASRGRLPEVSELWDRLTGPSVELPTESLQSVRRGLPGASSISSHERVATLLGLMKAGYEQAAETVASLSAVRDLVAPRLDELDQQLRAVETRAASVGIRLPNEAFHLKAVLEELQRNAESDPLSVDPARVASLASAVERIGSGVDAAVGEAASVDRSAEEVYMKLAAADEHLRAATEEAERASEKVVGGHAVVARCNDMAASLAVLRAEADAISELESQDRMAAARKLRSLGPRVMAACDDALRVRESCAAPLAARQELRGRLDAYRAKARATGRAEDLTLEQLYRAAEDALYSAPCDLVAAERRLEAYQAEILASRVEDR